jgi:hypothetical protein
MTQGIYIDGRRPKSKKEVKEAVAAVMAYEAAIKPGNGSAAFIVALAIHGRTRPTRVRLEATSFFGNEYDGPVEHAPDGLYFFVGPDPHTKRNFYGQVIVKDGQVTIK